jgi:hypothetical protein
MENVKQAHGQPNVLSFYRLESCTFPILKVTLLMQFIYCLQFAYGRMVRQLLQNKLEKICK